MAYIYIITNTITNKHYIGKTMNSVRYRVQEHFKESEIKRNPDTKLSRAILKYGDNCWKYSVLEECDLEVLSEREKYYINKYNTCYNGYNSTLGGDGQIRYEYDEEEIIDRYLKGESTADIAKTYGCHPHRIAVILKSHNIPLRVSTPVSIICFDRINRPLQVFNSKRSIAEYLAEYGYTQSMGNVAHYIKDACENGTRRFNRYWAYYDKDKHGNLKMNGRHEHKGENWKGSKNKAKTLDCVCKYCGIKIRTSVEKDICYNCEKAINSGTAPKPSKERFIELCNQYSLAEIAEMFGRSKSTIAYWRKQYNV